MERLQPHHLDAAAQYCEALAFDGRRKNRRPAFTLHQTLQLRPDGVWRSQRDWRAAGPERVASETIAWREGLVESTAEQPFLEELTRAVPQGQGCACTLRSPKTGAQDRVRQLQLPHPAVTLASLPLLVAQHWLALSQGTTLPASYLVLKVQRAATVHLHRVAVMAKGELVIAATPANPLLRWIFGSTRCIFDADAPRLRRIEGLLDPRDLKPNGRWHEYLGTIEFTKPLDLSAMAAQGALR
jgi:hypothetical protein